MIHDEDIARLLRELKDSSPCIGLCWIEPSEYCSGCGRTTKEIREFGAKVRELEGLLNDTSGV